MKIGTFQRTTQFKRWDSKIIAVHRVGQVAEARAAAVELSNGHRRNEGDAGAGRDIEIQCVGEQAAVLLAACQFQLRLRFKEVKGVQFQAERIFFFSLKGVDLSRDLCQFQRQHFGRVKTSCGVDTVNSKFVLLI